eukprot:755579-Hanusia_phi.AAC.4
MVGPRCLPLIMHASAVFFETASRPVLVLDNLGEQGWMNAGLRVWVGDVDACSGSRYREHDGNASMAHAASKRTIPAFVAMGKGDGTVITRQIKYACRSRFASEPGLKVLCWEY